MLVIKLNNIILNFLSKKEIYIFQDTFVRLKTLDKLSVNINHVYYTAICKAKPNLQDLMIH